jgi:hypothetical protein
VGMTISIVDKENKENFLIIYSCGRDRIKLEYKSELVQIDILFNNWLYETEYHNILVIINLLEQFPFTSTLKMDSWYYKLEVFDNKLDPKINPTQINDVDSSGILGIIKSIASNNFLYLDFE